MIQTSAEARQARLIKSRFYMTLLVAIGAGTLAGARQAPPVDDVLRAVGAYVAEYERAFSVVVSRERYLQRAFSGSKVETRELRSEVALVAVQGSEWLFFRDVLDVDGQQVHDRRDRLESLFLAPTRETGDLARRIYAESTRYNIGRVERTINSPTQALEFFRKANHSRSTFRLGRRSSAAGQSVLELHFEEAGYPRLVRTADNAAASGRAWVSPGAGAILRTELRLRTGRGSVLIVVHYSREDRLKMWVPERMLESYELPPPTGSSIQADDPAGMRVEGVATYSDFRHFTVDTRAIGR